MADNPTPPQQAPNAPQQIGVSIQYVKDFSFESPGAPQIFAPVQSPPEINLGVNIATKPMSDRATHEVVLMLKLEAKIGGKTAFIAELAYAGLFIVPAMPEEQLKKVLLVECPHLLFPFARSILANAVREGGFPQILIHPIDFMALYEANKARVGPIEAVAGSA